MENEIKNSIANPNELEKMYRSNKGAFKKAFNSLYPEVHESQIAKAWNARLNFEETPNAWLSTGALMLVATLSFFAGLIAKIPDFTGLKPDYFFPRNISFVVFPALAAYFALKQKFSMQKIGFIAAIFIASAVYINLLPDNPKSDTLILACIHLPLFLWAVFGFSYVGNESHDKLKRLAFLRYNGDLVVMTTIILIAGGLLTAMTLGLFSLIGLDIEHFYLHYIVVWGLAAAPIVGTHLVQTNPQLVSSVSPIIAKVFTPLVLIMLVVYLGAIIISGKDPYNDREFLLLFNVLLLGVMALILFSIAELKSLQQNKFGAYILIALSITTIAINAIALSAILFRLSTLGITPNRITVLGGNILILTNLVMVAYQLIKSMRNTGEIMHVENNIAAFLPIYALYAAFIAFALPIIFGFL